jgi:multiple sugar transport system permease protein
MTLARRLHLGSGFGFLMTVPALVAFAAVIADPLVRSIALAFQEYTLTTPEPVYVGLDNFRELLADPDFWDSWGRTIVFVVSTTALTVILGTAWGILLNEPLPLRRFLRSASLLPWVLPSVVTAMLWAWIFHGQYGLLNAGLLGTGLLAKPIFWLSDATGAMAAVVIAKAWLSTPVVMMFVLAAMQSLPMEHVEAARVDGAPNFALLRHIVLPHLRPVVLIVSVLQAMGNLQQFDVIYAMTGGGPVRATTTFSVEVYHRAFQDWNMGRAAAVGVAWLLTIAIPAIFYLRSILREGA